LVRPVALRRSELVEIDYQKRGAGNESGLAVLRMTDYGLELELLRSKTSREKPARIAVERHHNSRAFAVLEKWIAHAGIIPGTTLFRRIHPRGGMGGRITADGVNRAIKAALKGYYLATGTAGDVAERLASRFSGHSGRGGFVEGRRGRHGHRRHNAAQVAADDQALRRGGRATQLRASPV